MEKEQIYILTGEHSLSLKALSKADSSDMIYSFPLNYGNQVPIAFEVRGDYLSYEIAKDGQYNQVIKFQMPPFKKDEVKKIYFRYWVLTKKIDRGELLGQEFLPIDDKLPKATKKWLKPTKSIQSNNFFIRVTSRFLQGFSRDSFKYSKKVAFWICYHGIFINYFKKFLVRHPIWHRIFLPDYYWYPLEDAFSSLLFGGVCSAEANLQIALHRARGIPARLLITSCSFYGKDEWLDSQHYIAEIYSPKYGWVKTQSGMLSIPEEYNIIMKIADIEDENIAGNGLSKFGGMVSWFSISDDNIVFDVQRDYLKFKLPKSKIVGFPVLRAWGEKQIEVSSRESKKIVQITKQVWELFVNKKEEFNIKNELSLEVFSSMQKKALDALINNQFEKFILVMENIKDSLTKI